MQSYVGIAVDPATFERDPDELLSLELDGFREVDLGDAKVTLMLLRWTKDESAQASFLRALVHPIDRKKDTSD